MHVNYYNFLRINNVLNQSTKDIPREWTRPNFRMDIVSIRIQSWSAFQQEISTHLDVLLQTREQACIYRNALMPILHLRNAKWKHEFSYVITVLIDGFNDRKHFKINGKYYLL